MAAEKLDTSVFTDDSGGRRRLVAFAIRGAVGLLGLGAAAVAISVFGHVTLPGLDEPLHVPGAAGHHAVGGNQDTKAGSNGSGGLSAPGDGRPTGNATSTTTPGADSTTGPTTGDPTTVPTATPTAKATGKPTARPTTAAQPTHKPTAPPGKPTSRQTQ